MMKSVVRSIEVCCVEMLNEKGEGNVGIGDVKREMCKRGVRCEWAMVLYVCNDVRDGVVMCSGVDRKLWWRRL